MGGQASAPSRQPCDEPPGRQRGDHAGFSRVTWSIIPASFDFFWQPPEYPYDPAKAKQPLAEADYPKGFDAGDLWCDAATARMSVALIGYLQAVGIRVKLRPLKQAAFFKAYQEKKLRNIIYSLSGALGNAATRIETFVAWAALTSTETVPTSMGV